MEDFFEKLFSPMDFPPRWLCGEWSEFHGWLYVISDLAVFLAYLFIPLVLFHVTYKRHNAPFRRIFYLFIAFIWLCSITHLLDAVIFWYPLYRLNALMLFLTAVVSIATLVTLVYKLPALVALRSPAELEAIIEQQTAELKAANTKLALQEARFRELVNNNPDLIVSLDRSLRHVFVNKAIEEIRPGTKAKDYKGKHISELGFPPETLKRHTEAVERVFDTMQSEHYQVHYHSKQYNAERHMDISVVPMIQPEQEMEEVLVVSRDISTQKKQEQRLRENIEELQVVTRNLSLKNEQLQDFAYIVSHNLKTPIRNLRSLSELQKITKDPGERHDYQQKADGVLNDLQKTIDELDELVKLETAEEIPSSNCSLEDSYEQALQSLTEQIRTSNAVIEANFEVEKIRYPSLYLDSVLLNLISNAIKYRHRQRTPHIRIRSFREGKNTILTITDNGLGMDMEQVGDKLFKLHKTFHGNEDARGVGLYMTRRQIESKGGTIEVESQPGKGTTFRITFAPEATKFTPP